jgi:MtN3 and saliva related transmembrane protein
MEMIQVIGSAAGILTATSMLPQVIKTLKEKSAEDVALGMLIVLTLGQILWIVYGYQKDDWPIMGTNGFSILVNITMMFLRKKYGHANKKTSE